MLDIGANLGRFSIPFKTIWPKCDITMIEPNSFCFDFLSLTGNKLIVAALSDRVEERDFYLSKLDLVSSGASFYRENNPTTDHFNDENLVIEKLTTIRLDSLLGHDSFDFIKIDVQGSELEVLLGGENTIKKSSFVLIECGLADYNPGPPGIEEIIRTMQRYEFDMFDAIEFHRSTDLYQNCIFQMDIIFKNRK